MYVKDSERTKSKMLVFCMMLIFTFVFMIFGRHLLDSWGKVTLETFYVHENCKFLVFGRPFLKRFALCYRSIVCLSCLSVTLVYCGQTVGRIKMKLGMQVGLDPGHIVLHGDPAPPLPKGGRNPPIFGPYLLWPNRWMDRGCTWHGGRPQPRRLCVRWGPHFPSPVACPSSSAHIYCGEAPPQFSAQFYCDQTAGCIKMPLGMEVGFSPGDFVLDGNPDPDPKKGAEPPPIFGPYLLWPNGWMDQDGTSHGGRPWSRSHCARWGPSSPPQKGDTAPQFSDRLYCGQTAGCIKLALAMEVGLSPGDFVLDLSLIHIWRCRRSTLCRSRWSPYH